MAPSLMQPLAVGPPELTAILGFGPLLANSTQMQTNTIGGLAVAQDPTVYVYDMHYGLLLFRVTFGKQEKVQQIWWDSTYKLNQTQPDLYVAVQAGKGTIYYRIEFPFGEEQYTMTEVGAVPQEQLLSAPQQAVRAQYGLVIGYQEFSLHNKSYRLVFGSAENSVQQQRGHVYIHLSTGDQLTSVFDVIPYRDAVLVLLSDGMLLVVQKSTITTNVVLDLTQLSQFTFGLLAVVQNRLLVVLAYQETVQRTNQRIYLLSVAFEGFQDQQFTLQEGAFSRHCGFCGRGFTGLADSAICSCGGWAI